MGAILLFIFLVVMMVVFFIINYKKSESLGEKLFLLAYILAFGTPVIVLYLDMLNIPSILILTIGIDTKFWLENIIQYLANVVGASIGALVSIWVVLYEIKHNNIDTEKRDRENLRVQNIPILKYDITSQGDVGADFESLLMSKEAGKNGTVPYHLIFKLKNVGMNGIKSIKIKLESSILENQSQNIFGYNSIEMLEKGEEIVVSRYMALKAKNESYKMKAVVYYEDFLTNWYCQNIYIDYGTTLRLSKGRPEANITWNVEKEELMTKNEITELEK